MKRIYLIFFLLILFISSSALAAGGCPDSAERLEDFAGCMVPMPNGSGMLYRGTLASLHGDGHQALMQAMHTQPVVPPHPMPVPYGYWRPMLSVAAYKSNRNAGKSAHYAFWSWWAVSPMLFHPW